MSSAKNKQNSRIIRHRRIRSKIKGTAEKPRLSIYRSNKLIYAELIDDEKGHTMASTSGKNSFEAGKLLAKKAKEKSIQKIVFDRGGYIYTGRVMQFAQGAREGGLQF